MVRSTIIYNFENLKKIRYFSIFLRNVKGDRLGTSLQLYFGILQAFCKEINLTSQTMISEQNFVHVLLSHVFSEL
jgi:hypothetical protein